MRRLAALGFLIVVTTTVRAFAQTPAIVAPHPTVPLESPYPTGAHGDSTVVLVITVGLDGSVTNAKADGGEEPFVSEAERAARTWTFDPATRDGKAIPSKIRVAVTFTEPVPVDATAREPSPTVSVPVPPPLSATRRPSPPPEEPEEVVVRGKHEPGRSVSLGRAEVRQIPGAFGDPFRAVEMMPGVTPIVSGLPFFFIRGAPPGNAGYFLDGVRVPLLFHVGAGPSVVHPGLIDHVDLYPGGYPARFGRFAGGIVSGETAAPRKEFHGEGNVRLFDAGAMAEAPFANGRGTALIGGRYSFTGLLLSRLSNTVLNYWDYQARVTYDLTPDDRASVFAFGSYDFLGQKTATETLTLFGTQFHRVDTRYDRRLSSHSSVRVAVTGGFDRSVVQEGRFVVDTVLGTRVEYTNRLRDDVLLRAGADMMTDRYTVGAVPGTLSPSVQRITALFPSRSDLVTGARADVVLTLSPRFELTPGLRVDLFNSKGQSAVGVDPRVGLRTKLAPRVAMLSALGLAHQAPSFAIPVPGFQPGGLQGGLQGAVQESTGVEVDFGRSILGTLTVFHNGFFNMSDPLSVSTPDIGGCAPGTFPTGSLAGDRGLTGGGGGTCTPRFPNGTIGPDRSGGGGQGFEGSGTQDAVRALEVRTRGSSYGLELYLKKKLTSRIGGFVSYTLSRSTRSYGRDTFIASFDRTHVANAALAFDLGWHLRAGTRVVFYTGLPKAAAARDTGTRLPPFFRVDLRLERRWDFRRGRWLSIVAEWMNATLSKEAISTNCTLQGCESQTIGPVTIPSLGVEGGF